MRLVAAVFALAGALAGQTVTGGLRAVVRDPAGAAVAGAAVTLESEALKVKLSGRTGEDGAVQFLTLRPAVDYRVRAEAGAFAPLEREGVAVWTGQTSQLDLTLPLAGQRTLVEVAAPGTAAAMESAELAQIVDRRRLEALPANGRNLNRFALLDPHVRNTSGLGGDGFAQNRLSINGNIFRDTQYRLDGNTNYDTLFNNTPLQRLSMSAVGEFRVLTNQFNAEHGSTSTGVILTTTRAGSDEFHGEALFFGRPSGMQARPPLAGRHVPNQLLQYGASLGGPVKREATYFFVNMERMRQDRASFISSPAPGSFVGGLRDTLALARIDHRVRDDHWVALRLNGSRDTNTNANDRVGGLTQPSAAATSRSQTAAGQITDTVTGGSWVNEFRAGYVNAVPSNSAPPAPQVGAVRSGYSTEGGSSFSFVRTEVYQAADQLSWTRGAHSFKFGGDFIRRKVRDFSYDLFGTYTFPGGAPVAGQQPLQYSQRFGVARLRYGQTQWAGFAQDSWRMHARFTLHAGLRYDYQSILDDYNNFGPRAGFSWDVTGKGGTVVRGGFGLYYDQPFFHGLTQRFLLNGVDAPFATITFAPGNVGFPQYPFSYAPDAIPPGVTLAPRNVVIRGDKLLSPYATQFTLGVEQRLAGGWTLSLNGIRNLGVKQFIHYDRNAPSPFPRTQAGQSRTVAEADRTRPLYNAALGVSMYRGVAVRQLRQTENGGSAVYHGFDVGLKRGFRGRFQMEARYLLNSAFNNITDDHLGANPNEWSDVGRGERGPSDFAQRHRFVGHGLARLPWGVSVSGIVTAASALPVNALTGIDNNGDGNVTDRPAGFGRNAFRGWPQRSVDLSVSRTVRLGEKARVEFRGDVFNATNHSNFYSFNRNYGNGAAPVSTFLAPLGGVANADWGRQFTFGVRSYF